MAVTATGIIWVFTNADESATPFTTDKPLDFERLRWVDPTAAGHQVILKDEDGNVVFEAVASGDNTEYESEAPMRTRGLIIDTIDSGTLYLYHRVNV
jgi:hypothetical protein